MKTNLKQKAAIFFLSVILVSIALGPLYWVFITSFKPSSQTWGSGLGTLVLTKPTLENYKNILIHNKFWESIIGSNILRPVLNSFLVAIGVTAISLSVGALGGYGLAMFRMPGKSLISGYILFAYVFPPFLLIVPISVYFAQLGVLDSLVGVGLSHLIITAPYATWMLRGYFTGMSRDLVDSALVDGCTKVGALIKIILPISAPGVVTAAIFAFTRSWANFLYAFIILDSKSKYTLPVAAATVRVSDIVRWGELMGIVVIAALPPAILYMIIQKHVVQGLMSGATKG